MTDLTQDDIWPSPERMLQQTLDENRQRIEGQITSKYPDWQLIEGMSKQARQLVLALNDLRDAAKAREKLAEAMAKKES